MVGGWMRQEAALRIRPRFNIDYHVEYGDNYYSVPHALIGQEMMPRITRYTIEVLSKNKRVPAASASSFWSARREHWPWR